LIGYPLLIAASGMFFQVRLVAFTAILSLASYGMLQWFRHEDGPAHYPLIFAAALAVLGFIVGYQVYRVRVLTRYYQRRPIP
jgi:serine/threonine-protein kinase